MKLFLAMSKYGVALLFMFLFMGTVAADGPPSRKYKDHNWHNDMGQYSCPPGGMCVQLGANNRVNVALYAFMALNDISGYPPMRFSYTITTPKNSISGLTGPVTNSMLEYMEENGQGFYRATFPLPYDCIIECTSPAPPCHFSFTLTYQLVMDDPQSPGNYLPYPVGSYPLLWPPSIFEVPSPSYTDEVVTETKEICCYLGGGQIGLIAPDLTVVEAGTDVHGYLKSAGIENAQANVTMQAVKKEGDEFCVSPNPFIDNLTVKFNLANTGEVVFDCLDAQGKVVRRFVEVLGGEGVQTVDLPLAAIPPGLYYLRMSAAGSTRVAKLLKTGE